MFSYNFKSIFSLPYNFYLSLLLAILCFSPVFCIDTITPLNTLVNSYYFQDTTDNLRYSLHLFCIYFYGLHFVTIFRVLKPVLCFHMTSFNYGAKRVRDIDLTCICHQSNIMPDISSVLKSHIWYIAHCCLHFRLHAFVVLTGNSAIFAWTSKVEYSSLHLCILIYKAVC